MDTTQGLIAGSGSRLEDHPADCPNCGQEWGEAAPVVTALLGGTGLRRCRRCGLRSTTGDRSRALVFCEVCELPFVAEPSVESPPSCDPCRAGRDSLDASDDLLGQAIEAEVRVALTEAWTFVGSPKVSSYLERVARLVAEGIDGAPQECHVVLFDDRAVRTLALTSGSLLVSVGSLASIADEAELAFLLGHELAHAASGDAAARLMRMGFQEVARRAPNQDRQAWAQAVTDLTKLGFGRHRERRADDTALKRMLELGYDPDAAGRYLRRVARRVEEGDPEVADYALAHPTPADRLKRMEAQREPSSVDGPRETPRVNREVFRRAAGIAVLGSELHPVEPFAEPADPGPRSPGWLRSEYFRPAVGLVFLIALIAFLLLLIAA